MQQKYDFLVQEKEPFQNQMLASESQGFEEYQKRNDGQMGGGGLINPQIISGPSNVYFDERQFHDEDDSMAEYGNGENGKFNEDGSFIGLYGRDRVQTYVVQYNNNNNQNNNTNNQNNQSIINDSQANKEPTTSGAPYTTFV
jgi:hypothetical protein